MSNLTTAPPRLGNVLVDRGYVTVEQLKESLEVQKQGNGQLLGEVLVERGYCTDDQVVECLATVYGVPYAKLEPRIADPKAIDVLPREYIEKNLVFPLFKVRHSLTIAVTEPTNLFLIDELHNLTGLDVQVVATSAKDLRRMITTLPDSKTFVIDDIIEDNAQAEVTLIETAIEDIADATEFAGQSPVIRLVNYIIYNAVKEGASDIHIEPAERTMRVRYRIDGRLYKALEVPLNLLAAVSSRIKIMASLDISERRLPQDGRVHVLLEGRKIDLRVSTFPGSRGEKTAIRVLDTRSVSLNLRDLGFAEDVLTPLQAAIQSPNGIMLVTGPTGSGKSTTLYAALNEIASMENNVCTVEDPIEYHLSLINQFQVQERVGLTFSKALRTLLRQDPDVIMVGEIRDDETARTAIQAALTGHLVFSTLHTNDAVSAITRLINMGIEPYLIGAALNAVLAQRLVRRICAKCRSAYEPPRPMRKAVERMGLAVEKFFKGVGCRKCRNTGYSGRLGIHELLLINDEFRDGIVAGASVAALRQISDQYGMVTLRHDGFRKVREGLTSLEEVFQICGDLSTMNERRPAPSLAEPAIAPVVAAAANHA
jgi:type IV pilus assembly protein PilB